MCKPPTPFVGGNGPFGYVTIYLTKNCVGTVKLGGVWGGTHREGEVRSWAFLYRKIHFWDTGGGNGRAQGNGIKRWKEKKKLKMGGRTPAPDGKVESLVVDRPRRGEKGRGTAFGTRGWSVRMEMVGWLSVSRQRG